MDDESSNLDDLANILQDPGAQPCDLRLHDLQDITNDFSSEQELGRGGFGVVYKGVLPNGAVIAVKNLVSMSEVHEKQFKNEVDNLVRARHQNIVRFVGYCYESWLKYTKYNGVNVFAERPKRLLCFEYMPNGSLDRYISEECCGLDWHKRYNIIKGICRGLHYLHEECQINASLIHLDLKPANILLDDNMVPKIADFGLSKLFVDKNTQTYATIAGSRGYMAPEYLCNGTISPKADIYSLGVIIIEVITGRHIDPFSSVTSYQGFVGPVLRNWRNRFEAAPSYTSLEIDLEQIEKCLEIGLSCIKIDRLERPTTGEIMERLNRCESTNCYTIDGEKPTADKIKSPPKELLEITPLELRFCSAINRRIPCLVKLINKTDDYVAFYFGVVTAKNHYLIEPYSGFLWPRNTCNIVVTVQEQLELPLDQQFNDEFLVQSIVVGKYNLTSKRITVDMFNNMSSNLVYKVKLTGVYVQEAGLPPLATASSSGVNNNSYPAETKAMDSQPLEVFLVHLIRHQIRREIEKKGAHDVDIPSVVHDMFARIEYTGPEFQQSHDQPELSKMVNFRKDDLDLLTVILQCAEMSGLSKSDITKIIRSELTEGLEDVGAPDSTEPVFFDCQSSDETGSSSELPLPERLQKSASEKYFEVQAAVHAVEPESEDADVAARADDFIARFREQLRLQRMESILRYREMVQRRPGS